MSIYHTVFAEAYILCTHAAVTWLLFIWHVWPLSHFCESTDFFEPLSGHFLRLIVIVYFNAEDKNLNSKCSIFSAFLSGRPLCSIAEVILKCDTNEPRLVIWIECKTVCCSGWWKQAINCKMSVKCDSELDPNFKSCRGSSIHLNLFLSVTVWQLLVSKIRVLFYTTPPSLATKLLVIFWRLLTYVITTVRNIIQGGVSCVCVPTDQSHFFRMWPTRDILFTRTKGQVSHWFRIYAQTLTSWHRWTAGDGT